MSVPHFCLCEIDVTHWMSADNVDVNVFQHREELFARSNVLVNSLLEDREPFAALEHQSFVYVSVSGEAPLIPSKG